MLLLRAIVTLKFDSPRLRVLDLRHPHKTLSYEFDFNANHDL